MQADAEKKKHKAEMVELESTYESCTNDWESRSQISEARVSVLTQELAAIKSEQQCDHEKSTQLHNTVVALTTQMAEIAAANERLRLSVQAKDNDISQLKDSVANLSAEKFELSTQLEAALKCNHISSEVIGTKAHTDTTLSIDTETTTATAAEPSATELPSVAPETGTGSTVNNNSTPTHHVFHYVPHNSVEYSDQSWNEYVPPPSSTNAHAETYHHLYHAPPPRYTSPARFQSSAQVSSSLTARELATLMARSSSSRPSSRYASPLRRSYAPDFGESIGVGPVSHIDEIRMKLDILKSLTNQKIVAQRRPVMRVEREHFTPNVSFNDGLMSYYDNLRASLET